MSLNDFDKIRIEQLDNSNNTLCYLKGDLSHNNIVLILN